MLNNSRTKVLRNRDVTQVGVVFIKYKKIAFLDLLDTDKDITYNMIPYVSL